MFRKSMSLEEFAKLSHPDRLRRGYFDKVPLNLGLVGFTASIHLFSLSNINHAFAVGLGCYALGIWIKEKLIEKDDAEIASKRMEIEQEFRKRERKQHKRLKS